MTQQPTPISSTLFVLKTKVFQAKRLIDDAREKPIAIHATGKNVSGELIAESRTRLWTDDDPSEARNQFGKVHNLRLAARRLNGVEIPDGDIFSFWKQVGRTTKARGYVAGRELREGCLIPTLGGGLCQLSNALYDAALQAGFEIVERHAHSQTIPGSAAETGRDATVFWNYVDLRFRSQTAFRIEAQLTGDELIVRLIGKKYKSSLPISIAEVSSHAPNSCMSCGVLSCFRFQQLKSEPKFAGKIAYLVDDYWPEFDKYLQECRSDKDLLFMPIDGKRFRKQNYAWTTGGFGQIKTFPLFTLRRAIQSRRLAAQGAARQLALIENQATLAECYARALPYDATHIVVSQGLLPHLWLNGGLGGRTFDVLMTGLPMDKIHERLDKARDLHAESGTLGDFRANELLRQAEREALQQARRIITPHSAVAGLFGEKAHKLQWEVPHISARSNGQRIVFPASTLGRKGAYEVRAAARRLGLTITLAGPVLEDPKFWDDVTTEQCDGDWLKDCKVIVLPAFVENQPRRLLRAIAAGIPVIATDACGLEGLPGVRIVPCGNADALTEALAEASSFAHSI